MQALCLVCRHTDGQPSGYERELTLRVGNWKDEHATDERHRVLIRTVPSTVPGGASGFDVAGGQHESSSEPNQPPVDPVKTLGKRPSRAAAMVGLLRAEYFRLAEYIVDTPAAVRADFISGQIGDGATLTSKN